MAGKSTFLRMVGLNMVLAMAGANVAAEAMRLTPVALYTSMRTNDSLFTHTSFFYAELKKLRWIMDQIKSGKSIYIMLDEILKGTNSRDQHLGSAALIKNIIQNNGRGLIATHDIELTNLAASYPDHIKNIAFEIDMQGDKMIFSYQYRDGVCQNMNASTLMKQMGII
jgi:DNA mismatch repair ATPase MutS